MANKEKYFTIVLRGPSAVFFKPDEKFTIKSFQSSIGPVDITYRSRWIKRDGISFPGNLWIEVIGRGASLEVVLIPFANAGLALLPILTLSANAAIKSPEIEIAFESTEGLIERPYFQQHLSFEDDTIYSVREISIKETSVLLTTVSSHLDGERIRRAANQYMLALDYWKYGIESLALAHLWMALEALTKARIRYELRKNNLFKEKELADKYSIGIKELDSFIRQSKILKGDEICYKKSKEASDGFEHGYLGYDSIRSLARNSRNDMARYIREEIFLLLDLEECIKNTLINGQFGEPLGYWPVAKYLRGKLTGDGPTLAKPGNVYPFINWQTILKSSALIDKTLTFTFEDNFQAVVAENIHFTFTSVEVSKQT